MNFKPSDREKMLRRVARSVRDSQSSTLGYMCPYEGQSEENLNDYLAVKKDYEEELAFLRDEILQDRVNRKNGGLIDSIRKVSSL